MSAFEVQWVILCDSVNQFVDGKYLFNGVYAEDMMPGEPDIDTLSPFTIVMLLKPLTKDFTVIIQLSPENGDALTETAGTITGRGEVEDADRVVLPILLPPIKFPGYGRYKVTAGSDISDMRKVHSFRILPAPEVADSD